MMTLELSGMREALRKMRKIRDKKLYKRILRATVAAGAREISKAMKKLIPKDTGILRKSISVKMRVYKNMRVVAVIGPRTKFQHVVQNREGRIVYRWASKYAHFNNKDNRWMARAIYVSQRQARIKMIAEIKKQYRKHYAKL